MFGQGARALAAEAPPQAVVEADRRESDPASLIGPVHSGTETGEGGQNSGHVSTSRVVE